ncbi:MAG TPA: lytic murein transglycosylase, partial [Sphingomicrobium sp.]|nr:lytic murein transglycosylase [Sphingomicrobium sp.]
MTRISADPVCLSRRTLLTAILGGAASVAFADVSSALPSIAFEHWVAEFRPRALRHGISPAIYTQVMGSISPDMSVFAALHKQPEFNELLWQYINRRCSDWRVITGKERARQYAHLFARIERDYGVDRYALLG